MITEAISCSSSISFQICPPSDPRRVTLIATIDTQIQTLDAEFDEKSTQSTVIKFADAWVQAPDKLTQLNELLRLSRELKRTISTAVNTDVTSYSTVGTQTNERTVAVKDNSCVQVRDIAVQCAPVIRDSEVQATNAIANVYLGLGLRASTHAYLGQLQGHLSALSRLVDDVYEFHESDSPQFAVDGLTFWPEFNTSIQEYNGQFNGFKGSSIPRGGVCVEIAKPPHVRRIIPPPAPEEFPDTPRERAERAREIDYPKVKQHLPPAPDYSKLAFGRKD